MIKVYNSSETQFKNNGLVVLLPSKCEVHNEDNGDFYLELTADTKFVDCLKENNIIVCNTPQGEQPFRIRQSKISNKKIEVTAYHVYYDSENYLILDSYAQNLTAGQALNHFKTATVPQNAFIFDSDINTRNNFRCVRKSLREAIDTVVERWGGHLKRDKWSVALLNEIGVDNGITIEYRKNLKEMTATYSWNDVVTQLLPVGNDGIMLPEQYIYKDSYDIPYCKTVDFDQEGINREDYDSDAAYTQAIQAELRKQAQEYINIHYLPQITYELKATPEKVTDIGDYILVKDKEIGINLITQVVAYEYDAISERYTSLEFGNYKTTMKKAIVNLIKSTK
jgi:phage minor structural protein